MIRWRTILVTIAAVLCISGPVWQGRVSAADDTQSVREEIETAGKKLKELKADKSEWQRKEQVNRDAQEKAAGEDALRQLKQEANDIAAKLGELDGMIRAAQLDIDAAYGRLRSSARAGTSTALDDASAKLTANDAAGAKTALAAARAALRAWKDALRERKLTCHKESARLRNASSSLELAAARSELSDIENALSRLDAEKDRLTAECTELQGHAKRDFKHANWPDTLKDIKDLLDEIEKRQVEAADRRASCEMRRTEIERFLGKAR